MEKDLAISESNEAQEVSKVKRNTHRSWMVFAAVFFLLLAIFAACMAGRYITPLLAGGYSIRGVDVSHYQGEIDWQELAAQDISFAYIKATEGTTYTDECFKKNWAAASETELAVGAYHFFSFSSPGKNQAEHFIEIVGSLSGKLIPAVDVEYYGSEQPDKEAVIQELTDLLKTLEEMYDVKPVIYTTYTAYHDFIKGNFDEYPLWIRNVYFTPNLGLLGKWSIWQYTDREILDGYSGEERYIDVDVFGGNEEEWKAWVIP